MTFDILSNKTSDMQSSEILIAGTLMHERMDTIIFNLMKTASLITTDENYSSHGRPGQFFDVEV